MCASTAETLLANCVFYKQYKKVSFSSYVVVVGMMMVQQA